MRKHVLSFGANDIVLSLVEKNNKKYRISHIQTFKTSDYYMDSGVININAFVEDLCSTVGKKIQRYDMDIILPDYMTTVEYKNATELDGVKANELKDLPNSKLKDKKINFIGEIPKRTTSQITYYNSKVIKALVREFHKKKIPATYAVSRCTASQDSPSLLTSMNDLNMHENRAEIIVVTGQYRISYIICIGKLPVEIRESDFNLYRIYESLKELFPDIKFKEFMEHVSSFSVFKEYEREQEGIQESKVKTHLEEEIETELTKLSEELMRELLSIEDFIMTAYDSKALDPIFTDKIGERLYVQGKSNTPDKIEINGSTIEFRGFKDTYEHIVVACNEIIQMKKGDDFYE